MKKEDIKKIMIVHSDNDFVRVWDWIGQVTLFTIKNENICDEDMLLNSDDIEKFIHSLLPTAIEFVQYRAGRYRDIDADMLKYLTEYFNHIRFVYNFDEKTDNDWKFGGSETLIIDIENNESYIR